MAKFSLIGPGQTKPSSKNLPESNYEQFYQPVYAKFHIDNETLSQVKFQILSPNYKLSLLKEKVETGKYFCNYDQQQNQQHLQPQLQPQQPPQQLPVIKTAEPQKISTTSSPTPNEESSTKSAINSTTSTPTTPITAVATMTQRKTPAAGSLSTHIGSTVDVLLNY